ncbi:MAG: trypsin-like peptidase domain-containing protein [Acutalibacter sp.]|nr:trypsin-like peptidase domain-containing protein [Acutalibacter sp.]
MKKKFVLLALAVVLVAAISVTAFAVLEEPEEEPYVDSWEATENMTDEELIAIGHEILGCGQGSLPQYAFAVCFRLEEIDPDLADACFDYILKNALPAEQPKQKENVPQQQDGEDERFGVYVRDGNGGHYEYYDFDDETSAAPEVEDNSILEEDDLIIPQAAGDRTTIYNPKDNLLTSTICKIVARRNDGEWSVGSGFFLNDTVVGTAAHVIYPEKWAPPLSSSGWAYEVFIVQAYAPTATDTEPYGRVFADCKQMAVGAKWKDEFDYDADWGLFVLRGTMKGSNPCLTRKQIDPKSYTNTTITYGYPSGADYSGLSMLRITGKASTKPVNAPSYRVLYSTDSQGAAGEGYHGMSGGPVLDAYGKVIGIFTGTTADKSISPQRAMAVGMDVDLYKFLSRYK